MQGKLALFMDIIYIMHIGSIFSFSKDVSN